MIDDEQSSAERLVRLLKKYGAQTILTTNRISEARKLLETEEVKLLFLDLNMEHSGENENGMLFLDELRAAGNDIIVCIVTREGNPDLLSLAVNVYEALGTVYKRGEREMIKELNQFFAAVEKRRHG